jgi:hypothetical protein
MDDDKRCKFTAEDGTRCKAWTLRNREFCFSHDPSPEVKQAKLEAVTKGGLAREVEINVPLEVVEISSPRDVVSLLVKVIAEVRSGAIDPKIGGTLGYLAGCLLKAYELCEVSNKADEVKAVLTTRASTTARRQGYDR